MSISFGNFSWLMMMWLRLLRDERLCLSRKLEIPTDVKVKNTLNNIYIFNVVSFRYRKNEF